MAFSLNLGALSVTLGMDADAFTKGVKEAKSEWASLKSSLSSSGAALGKSVAAAGALAAGGVALVAKAASDLETELTKAAAVSQGGMANFADFKRAAMEASSGSAASAKQAGESLKFLAMAGFSAQEAMTALPETIRLASAAGMDLGRSADIASDILTGFGLKAQDLAHANDVLVLGFTRTNTNLEMLAESMKYIGPVAQSSGQSIESMTAAVGLMANVGVKGSQAGTSLRMALLQMQKPPKRAQEALAALGVQIVDSSGKMRDFVDIVGDFERAQSRFGQADFTAKVGQVVGTEAVAGFLGIINQGEGALRKLRDEMVAAKGTTAELEKQMLSTFAGQLQLAQGNIENLLAIIGDAFLPVLKEFAALTTQVATALQKDATAQAEWSKGLTEAVHAVAGMVEMSALLAQVMGFGVGILAEAAVGWQKIGMLISATMDAYGALAVYMMDGDMKLLEANAKKVNAQYDAIIAMGDFGDELKKTTALADKYGDAASKVAGILNKTTITIQGQTAAVVSQEEAIKRAAEELRKYGAQWRGVGEGSNFVEQPRWIADAGRGKFAGKDTRPEAPGEAADRKRAAEARKRAAEERAQLAMREKIAQMELDALAEADKWTQLDMQAQAQIEGLKMRQLTASELELETSRILLKTEQEKYEWLKKETEEREKQAEIAKKLVNNVAASMLAGATQGQSAGVAQKEVATDQISEENAEMLGYIATTVELIDTFSGLLGPLGESYAKAAKAVEAGITAFMSTDDMFDGIMAGLEASLMSLASSYVDMITSTEAFQENMQGLSAAFGGLGLSDFLNSLMRSWQPAIGAIISVFKSFGGFSFDKMFEDAGRFLFKAVKGFLDGILMFQELFAWANYMQQEAITQTVRVINTVANKLAEWVDSIPGFDRPDTSAINNFFKSVQKGSADAKAELDDVKRKREELAKLTYEQGQAIFDETIAREKATESLAELNDELRNAPSGFKIALARFRVQDAAARPESMGGGSTTVIQSAYLLNPDAAFFKSQMQRATYVRTGSTTALQQRLFGAIASKP
jgi:TP901 family phage tail tape measure protein